MAGGEQGQFIDGGRFELLERLGSGGMGTVWRARDTALHREVALKEVRPADPSLADPDAADSEGARTLRERVLREARALARLSDPRVVTIHQIVEEGPYPWLVMELLPPGSLQDRIDEGPLEPRAAARLGRQVLGALRTAHAAGIQHRDVKPSNVLLRADGSAVLTDFGIAGIQGSQTLTVTGEFLGSPEYIAPERIRGTDDDPASDLWSLGMTLYVCTEGHSPLRRGTTLATLAAVLDEPVPPPERSGELTPVLNALLVRDSAARPDAETLDRMLADAEEGRGSLPYVPTATSLSAPPPGPQGAPTPPRSLPSEPLPPGTPPDRRRSRTGLAVVGAVVAAALIAGGTYLLARPGDGEGDGGNAKGGATASPATEEPGGARPSKNGTQRPGPDPSGGPGKGKTSPRPTDAAPTTKKPKPPKPGGGGTPGNSWVAQLGSVAKSDGLEARAKMNARLNAKAGPVRWLDSDKYASLRPGYWMFYRSGPFDSGRAAADWCADNGLTGSDRCVGRYVSDDAADRSYICSSDKSEATGRCRR